NFNVGTVGNQLGENPWDSIPNVDVGVVFIKGLNGVGPQWGNFGCLVGRINQDFVQFVNQWKLGADLDEELQGPGILATRHVRFGRQPLVLHHRVVNDLLE